LAVSAAMLVTILAVLIATIVARTGDSSTPATVFGLAVSPARTDTPRPASAPPATPNPSVSPVPILTTRPTGHLLSMPWELVGLRDNARTLVVHYLGGNGVRPGGIYAIGFRVIDSPTSVELIAVSRDDNPGSHAQAASLQAGYGTITLPMTITGRTLLHAPVDPDWPPSLLQQ